MTATVCRAHRCLFHLSRERCGAEHIAVMAQEAGAFCSTFKGQEVNTNTNDQDTLGMSNSAMVSSDPAVECQALTCFYNQDMACFAVAIEVQGDEAVDSTDTRCKTYLPAGGDETGAEGHFELRWHAD